MKGKIFIHLIYGVVALFSVALFLKGVEEIGLLVVGTTINGTITKIGTRKVRVGRRGSSSQPYADYEFKGPDGKTYKGHGDWEGFGEPVKGDQIAIYYLYFAPSYNEPKGSSVIPGIFLTICGGFLAIGIVTTWWKRILKDLGKKTRIISPS